MLGSDAAGATGERRNFRMLRGTSFPRLNRSPDDSLSTWNWVVVIVFGSG